MKKLRIYAPASSANLAAGFDSLGAALAPEDGTLWGDIVAVESAEQTTLETGGEYANALPSNPDSNLAWMTWKLFEERISQQKIALQPMRIHLEKRLPISSGLGSSASTIVASLLAYNRFHGDPLGEDALLDLAAQAEGGTSGARHFDNVAPSLLGGLQLITPKMGGWLNPAIPLPFKDEWRLVVIHPDFQLSTRESRGVLPKEFPLTLVVEQSQLLAGFVTALHRGDDTLLGRCGQDRIAEPHRALLVPGYHDVKDKALRAGALLSNLSGSGPSVFAWCRSDRAPEIKAAMVSAFENAGLKSRSHICKLDTQGAREV